MTGVSGKSWRSVSGTIGPIRWVEPGHYHLTLKFLGEVHPDRVEHVQRVLDRVAGGTVRELIIAVNATVEGQTTAHYITDQLSGLDVKITRLAHGVPVGGELDYLDEGTLTAALRARTAI